MANILGLITINNKEIIEVDGNPSAGAGTPAPVGSLAQYENGSNIGQEYLKVGTADTAWDRITTLSDGGILEGTYLRLPIYSTDATGYTLDDTVTQNTHAIDIAIQAQPSRSVAIEYRIPNPGNAISAVDFMLTQGDQIVYGLKTFQDGLVVNGTLTFINTTNLEVTDQLIRVNKGGPVSTSLGSGFEVESNTTATATGVTNAGAIFTSTGVGTTQNGKTVTIIDTSAGGLSLVSDTGSAVTIDLGGAGPVSPSAINALTGLLTVTASGSNISLPEVFTLGGATTGIKAYWKTSANGQGWDSLVPSNAFALTLNQNNLTAAHVQKYANTSGTFVMRPDGTPGVAGQIAYWSDANNLISAAGLSYVGGVLTTPDITVSNLGLGVVHSSAAGVLSSSPVALASEVSGILPIGNGGTNSSTALTNGRLMYSAAGAIVEYSALVPNQVYFGAATTGLPAQSVNLFWDITNSRLGIGTATPSRPLDVNGSVLFQGSIRYADAAHVKANYETFQGQVQTTNATPASVATIALPTNSEILVTANIMGRDNSSNNSAAYIRTARFKNVGGVCTINTLQSDYTSEDVKAWDGTLVVSGTNALVQVTGVASTTIDWTVTYFVQTLS